MKKEQKKAKLAFKKLMGKKEILILMGCYGFEDPVNGTVADRSELKRVTYRQFLERLVDIQSTTVNRWKRYNKNPDNKRPVIEFPTNSFEQCIATYKDIMCEWSEDCVVIEVFGSEKEYEAYKLNEQRELLEQLANEFAKKHNLSMNKPFEFLDKLSSAIEREEDYREGLSEDGLCATSCGIGNRYQAVEEWFDMKNSSGIRESGLVEIMDWISQACPLAYLQWTEKKATSNTI